ncbi:MAG: hypothetical protein IIV65_04690 [Alistipes sp.]|nr:hypothetical protein [Alistipes sp.]
MAKKFNIQIRSTYAEIWRYNIAISCGCTDSAGNVVEVVGEQDNVAPVGSNLKVAPDGFTLPREVRLSTPETEGIVAYIYLVPHTLPAERDIAESEPFKLSVKVSASRDTIYNVVHKVNQWSGTSIELKL